MVIATLNGGDYWNDHIALYEYGFSQTESVELPLPELAPLSVAGGVSSTVALQASAPTPITLLKGESASVICRVERPAFEWAPVKAGEPLGRIVYELNGKALREVPITAVQTVDERTPMSFLKKWMRQVQRLLTTILR